MLRTWLKFCKYYFFRAFWIASEWQYHLKDTTFNRIKGNFHRILHITTVFPFSLTDPYYFFNINIYSGIIKLNNSKNNNKLIKLFSKNLWFLFLNPIIRLYKIIPYISNFYSFRWVTLFYFSIDNFILFLNR